MFILWDARKKRNVPRACSPSGSGPAGNAPRLGMPMDLASEAIDPVDVALARQELLAAANASTPLGRAIISHLAASIAGRAEKQEMSANRIPGPDRSRE